jgi:leucyl aminopeptidase
MELRHLAGNLLETQCDVLAVTCFGDPTKDSTVKSISTALGGMVLEAAVAESFEGKSLQALGLHTGGKLPAKRVLVIGLGSKSDFSAPQLRDVTAAVVAHCNKVGAVNVAFLLPTLGGKRDEKTLQHAAEGVYLGGYKFDRYLTSEDSKKKPTVKSVSFLTATKAAKVSAAHAKHIAALLERGTVVSRAINVARNYVNEPAAVITPTALANEAEALAKKHKSLTVTILNPKKCAELGMGMFLAVGQGSDQEARFIHIKYTPVKKPKKKIALIGKGITFDSGGYSLKPSSGMEDMKVDMSGAAAVIASMDAIATLGSEHEVHAVAACCENLVSGRAYKLGDILKSMDGTTVEINNTDAEGRLTLGDAITYARTKIEPDEMFDFATLTGACMVALGPYTAGVMSDHEALLRNWMAAAERSGEDMWRLPLNPRLREQLKSPIADMRNTGDRFGGAITAGLFLKVFAKDTPYVHVDIAGPASVGTSRPATPKGGTGFAVATILEYVTTKS